MSGPGAAIAGRRPVGWAVVGGSGFAAAGAVPAVLGAGNARLVAVLSRDPGRARRSIREARGLDLAERLGGPRLAGRLRYGRVGRRLGAARRLGHLGGGMPRVVDAMDALLDDPAVEAVWVASPPDLHRGHAIAALEAGKHVLCEKPLATTAEDARAMVAAADRSGQMLAVGFHMRQHPAIRALHESIGSGEFGRLESLRARLQFPHPSPSDWIRSKERSGGWAVCEAGTHLVDLALWFLGDGVATVEASLSSERLGFETDDHAVLTVGFDGGAEARLEVVAGQMPPRLEFELVGADRWARCEDILLGAGGVVESGPRGSGGEATSIPPIALHRLQAEQFGRAVRGDRSAAVVPAAAAVRNLEIIERARGW